MGLVSGHLSQRSPQGKQGKKPILQLPGGKVEVMSKRVSHGSDRYLQCKGDKRRLNLGKKGRELSRENHHQVR